VAVITATLSTVYPTASIVLEAGWSDTQVMAQSGHRDPKSLKRYTNLRKAPRGRTRCNSIAQVKEMKVIADQCSLLLQ
jgi:hypothetical protein